MRASLMDKSLITFDDFQGLPETFHTEFWREGSYSTCSLWRPKIPVYYVWEKVQGVHSPTEASLHSHWRTTSLLCSLLKRIPNQFWPEKAQENAGSSGARGTRWLRGRWERGNRLQHRHRPRPGVGEQHIKRRGHSHLTVPVLPVVHLGGSQPRLLKLVEHVLHIAKLPPAVGGGHWRRVQPLGLRADHDLAQRSPGKQLHPAAECSAVQPPKHHLGPVRHQVGDLGASPPGEGDQQSRRAGGGDGVIVEEETHPPARSCHLPCSGLGWTDQSQGGWLPHGISNFYLPVTIPPVHHAVDYKEFTGTGFKLRYFR